MKRSSVERLDSVLAGLEALVLSADPSDLGVTSREAGSVRRLIAGLLPARVGRRAKATVPANLADKLSLLRELAARRPELRARLAFASRDRKQPSASEIDVLIQELIQSGELKDTK